MTKKKYIIPDIEIIQAFPFDLMEVSNGWSQDGGNVIPVYEDDDDDDEFKDLD